MGCPERVRGRGRDPGLAGMGPGPEGMPMGFLAGSASLFQWQLSESLVMFLRLLTVVLRQLTVMKMRSRKGLEVNSSERDP